MGARLFVRLLVMATGHARKWCGLNSCTFFSCLFCVSVKVELQHGSLLMMNPPTNKIWYHSLPVKKSAVGVRINMTFRKYNGNVAKK